MKTHSTLLMWVNFVVLGDGMKLLIMHNQDKSFTLSALSTDDFFCSGSFGQPKSV